MPQIKLVIDTMGRRAGYMPKANEFEKWFEQSSDASHLPPTPPPSGRQASPSPLPYIPVTPPVQPNVHYSRNLPPTPPKSVAPEPSKARHHPYASPSLPRRARAFTLNQMYQESVGLSF